MSTRSRQRGYTVVELMIAMIIFSVGIMAVYSLQVMTVSSLAEARDLTEATNLAARIMEQLRRDSTAWVTGNRPPGVPVVPPDQWIMLYEQPINKDGLFEAQIPNTSPSSPPQYCVKYRLTEVGGVGSGTYQIDMRVMWPRREASAAAFARCPADMDSAQNIPLVRQVPLPGGIIRH